MTTSYNFDNAEYTALLEEFIRASLWSDNYHENFGVSADADADEFGTGNRRADRLRAARKFLRLAAKSSPDRNLFDEVEAENKLIYDGMDHDVPEDETDAAWKLLRERGLVQSPSMAVPSTYKQNQTSYVTSWLNELDADKTNSVY